MRKKQQKQHLQMRNVFFQIGCFQKTKCPLDGAQGKFLSSIAMTLSKIAK
jgi:hypothetical protein